MFEAFEGYWRKMPAVKRLVFKVVPEEATRLAALKRGEVDLAYSIRGELAEELQKTPGLTLKPVVIQGTFWLYFPDQWDPKSPWHDQRVRDAARLAIDYKSISEALTLGYSPITNNIIPDSFDFYWKPPAAVYDLAKAKKLLAEAGFPTASTPATITAILLRQSRRGRDQQPAGSRHPREAAAAGTRRLLQGLCREEAQEHHPGLVAARSATPRRGWRRSWSRAAPMPMAAIPRSMRCSRAGERARRRQAQAMLHECSRSCTRSACMHRSGSSPSSTASASAWANPPSA